MINNGFTHMELNSTDPEKSIDFFKTLFPDWKFDELPSPAGPYTVIKPVDGATCGGAIFKNPQPGCPSMWVPYIMVADLKAMTAKLEAMNATIHIKLHDVGVGLITLFLDPTGAVTGLFEPKPGMAPSAK